MSQPAHKIRVGLIQVAIWKNRTEKGVFYSVTPSRSYQKDEAWQESTSFAFDDLLTVAKLIDQAHSWISRRMQAEFKARNAREEAATAEE